MERQRLRNLFRPLQVPDMFLADVPEMQSMAGRFQQILGACGHFGNPAFPKLCLALEGQQVFLLCGDKVRAVNGEEPLPFLHMIAGGAHKKLFDPPMKLDRDLGKPSLIDGHTADGPDLFLKRALHDLFVFHPDHLKSFRRNRHNTAGDWLRRSRRLSPSSLLFCHPRHLHSGHVALSGLCRENDRRVRRHPNNCSSGQNEGCRHAGYRPPGHDPGFLSDSTPPNGSPVTASSRASAFSWFTISPCSSN